MDGTSHRHGPYACVAICNWGIWVLVETQCVTPGSMSDRQEYWNRKGPVWNALGMSCRGKRTQARGHLKDSPCTGDALLTVGQPSATTNLLSEERLQVSPHRPDGCALPVPVFARSRKPPQCTTNDVLPTRASIR